MTDQNKADERQQYDRRQSDQPEERRQRGYDRRTGIDRRQDPDGWRKEMIRRTKIKIVERFMMTTGVVFFIIVLIGGFLMMPEYKKMQEQSSRVSTLEAELEKAQRALEKAQEEGAKSQIRKEGHFATAMGTMTGLIDKSIDQVERNIGVSGQTAMIGALEKVDNMQKTATGEAAYNSMMQELKSRILSLENNNQDLNSVIAETKAENATLSQVLKDVSARDLTVATGLLTLNQIRSAAQQDFTPFADDLKVIEKIAGNHAGTRQRISELAPLAAEGVLSTASLQKEFQALAAEIALAKMRGENISLEERARAHLDKAIKIRKNDMSAQNNQGAVARAKAALERGDTQKALLELQSLDEAGRTVASPWMEAAEKRVVADQSIDRMINDFITGFKLGGIGAEPGSATDFGGATKHLLDETLHGTQAPIVSP